MLNTDPIPSLMIETEIPKAKILFQIFEKGACSGESNASVPNDEQSRRTVAWQQKRTQEMMTLKRRNQTLEAGAERLKAELDSARAESDSLKGQLEAEVASSKARNSSTWRLRQENERLQKAEAAWKEQQAHGAGGDCLKPMAATGSPGLVRRRCSTAACRSSIASSSPKRGSRR